MADWAGISIERTSGISESRHRFQNFLDWLEVGLARLLSFHKGFEQHWSVRDRLANLTTAFDTILEDDQLLNGPISTLTKKITPLIAVQLRELSMPIALELIDSFHRKINNFPEDSRIFIAFYVNVYHLFVFFNLKKEFSQKFPNINPTAMEKNFIFLYTQDMQNADISAEDRVLYSMNFYRWLFYESIFQNFVSKISTIRREYWRSWFQNNKIDELFCDLVASLQIPSELFDWSWQSAGIENVSRIVFEIKQNPQQYNPEQLFQCHSYLLSLISHLGSFLVLLVDMLIYLQTDIRPALDRFAQQYIAYSKTLLEVAEFDIYDKLWKSSTNLLVVYEAIANTSQFLTFLSTLWYSVDSQTFSRFESTLLSIRNRIEWSSQDVYQNTQVQRFFATRMWIRFDSENHIITSSLEVGQRDPWEVSILGLFQVAVESLKNANFKPYFLYRRELVGLLKSAWHWSFSQVWDIMSEFSSNEASVAYSRTNHETEINDIPLRERLWVLQWRVNMVLWDDTTDLFKHWAVHTHVILPEDLATMPMSASRAVALPISSYASIPPSLHDVLDSSVRDFLSYHSPQNNPYKDIFAVLSGVMEEHALFEGQKDTIVSWDLIIHILAIPHLEWKDIYVVQYKWIGLFLYRQDILTHSHEDIYVVSYIHPLYVNLFIANLRGGEIRSIEKTLHWFLKDFMIMHRKYAAVIKAFEGMLEYDNVTGVHSLGVGGFMLALHDFLSKKWLSLPVRQSIEALWSRSWFSVAWIAKIAGPLHDEWKRNVDVWATATIDFRTWPLNYLFNVFSKIYGLNLNDPRLWYIRSALESAISSIDVDYRAAIYDLKNWDYYQRTLLPNLQNFDIYRKGAVLSEAGLHKVTVHDSNWQNVSVSLDEFQISMLIVISICLHYQSDSREMKLFSDIWRVLLKDVEVDWKDAAEIMHNRIAQWTEGTAVEEWSQPMNEIFEALSQKPFGHDAMVVQMNQYIRRIVKIMSSWADSEADIMFFEVTEENLYMVFGAMLVATNIKYKNYLDSISVGHVYEWITRLSENYILREFVWTVLHHDHSPTIARLYANRNDFELQKLELAFGIPVAQFLQRHAVLPASKDGLHGDSIIPYFLRPSATYLLTAADLFAALFIRRPYQESLSEWKIFDLVKRILEWQLADCKKQCEKFVAYYSSTDPDMCEIAIKNTRDFEQMVNDIFQHGPEDLMIFLRPFIQEMLEINPVSSQGNLKISMW